MSKPDLMNETTPYNKQSLNQNEEIDFLELIGVLWVHRHLIVTITVVSLVVSIIFVKFFSSATTNPNNIHGIHHIAKASFFFPRDAKTKESMGPIAAELFSSFALYEMVSKELSIFAAYQFNDANESTKKKIYNRMRSVGFQYETGILRVEFFHKDAKIALQVLQHLVTKVQDQLPKFERLSPYVIESPYIMGTQDLEPATDEKLYIFFGTGLGFIVSVSLAFALNILRRIRSTPEAIKRLQGQI